MNEYYIRKNSTKNSHLKKRNLGYNDKKFREIAINMQANLSYLQRLDADLKRQIKYLKNQNEQVVIEYTQAEADYNLLKKQTKSPT